MNVKAMWKRNERHMTFLIHMLISLLVGIIFSVYMYIYPRIELTVSNIDQGEFVRIYSLKDDMMWDNEHMAYEIVKSNVQKVSISVPGYEMLCINLGSKPGMIQVSNMKIKTLFTIREIPISYLLSCVVSEDIASMTGENEVLYIESIGIHPYLIMMDLNELRVKFNIGSIFSILIVFAIVFAFLEFIEKYSESFQRLLKKNKYNYNLIFLGTILFLFFCVSLYWLVEYWPFMPFVDESATVSAVNNLIEEGVARVGINGDSVMFERAPEVQYYWSYFLEIILRVPLQIANQWLGLDNIQAITNLIYVAAILLVIFCVYRLWIFDDKSEDKKKYLFIVALTMLCVTCSEGLMSLVHYVRYYSMAMMSFIASTFIIPVYWDDIERGKRTDIWKVFALGILPGIFHLLYIPYYCIVILITLICLKNKGILKKVFTKKIMAIAIAGSFFALCGVGYVLSIKKTDVLGLITVNMDSLTNYAYKIVSDNKVELFIALCVFFIDIACYRKQLPVIKRLEQLIVLTLLCYAPIIGSNTAYRYYFSLKICYITLVVIAFYDLCNLFSHTWKQYRKEALITTILFVLLWGSKSSSNIKNYPGLSLVTWNEFHNVEQIIAEVNPEKVIIFSDCVLPINLEHPEWYTCFFRSYEEISQPEVMQYNGSIYYYLNDNGFYYTIFNSMYVGKKKDINRLLKEKEFEDSEQVYIMFWRVDIYRPDAEVQQFFMNADINQEEPIKLSEFKVKWENFLKEY